MCSPYVKLIVIVPCSVLQNEGHFMKRMNFMTLVTFWGLSQFSYKKLSRSMSEHNPLKWRYRFECKFVYCVVYNAYSGEQFSPE